jgi:transcriptional regulator with XRE-family HTH domain
MRKVIEYEVNTLGEYLLFTMRQRGLSTRAVAKELKLAPSTLWRISTNRPFRINSIIPVAKWCGITPDLLWQLLEGKERI